MGDIGVLVALQEIAASFRETNRLLAIIAEELQKANDSKPRKQRSRD